MKARQVNFQTIAAPKYTAPTYSITWHLICRNQYFLDLYIQGVPMGRLFGTDGVRGVANLELTADLAFKLGQAGAWVLAAEKRRTPRILVGTDTRVSKDMLEAAMVAGICSVGAVAVCLGIIPTPAVAYLTRKYGADAGVVISASHNSFEFNGIKFFDDRGYKLPDAIEDKIEAIALDNDTVLPRTHGHNIGFKIVNQSTDEDYVDFLREITDVDFSGMKIAVDCANGAAYRVAPKLFSSLGAEVYTCACEPDGKNINDRCGSTHIENISAFAVQSGADVGLAFDGDADRLIAVDHTGEPMDGDKLMAIIGLQLKKEGKLVKNTIVTTVMSNLGLDIMAQEHGIELVKTRVGDRYVLEKMLEEGYEFGGENSGHLINLKHNTTGDGLVTALQLLQIMKKTGSTLKELASVMTLLPQVLINARVDNDKKKHYLEDEVIAEQCRKLEEEFRGEGRVLIRPSGTEPLIRVMIEGKDPAHIEARAKELACLIEKRLG